MNRKMTLRRSTMKSNKMIQRYKFIDRACHWTVAISFFMVALSGIAMFFPTLQWLTETFGTPQMGRILHPFFGILIICMLIILFIRFARHNLPERGDLNWFVHIIDVLKGYEHKVTDVGIYNPGQKVMFWSIMGLMLTLAISGTIMWRPYFAHFFPIYIIRIALCVHAVAAILLCHLILMHMYMAFWIKGSITGMIEGYVSPAWAKKHHPRWYRQLIKKQQAKTINDQHAIHSTPQNEADI